MKQIISILLIFSSICITAQNTVKMSAVKSNDFGVSYSLPKTAISVNATINKKTRKAGEFYQYAERYLNIPNPISEDEVIYTLDKVEANTIGIPDKENSYLVEFRTNTLAPFVTLTKDGLICAINEDVDLSPNNKNVSPQNNESSRINDPKTYLSEEILRAGSTAKQAELIAKQIYRLRESRTNILTGEADNMPPDGNAYKMMMEQLDEQEKALTSMFVGQETSEVINKEVTVVPDENDINKKIIFRFSKKLGIVEANDLAGSPIYLTLTNKTPKDNELVNDKEQKALEKKFSSGIIYNIPAKAFLKVEFDNQILTQKECDIIQYGTKDVLAPKMLSNGKNPIKVIFFPELGAIKQIVQ